MYPRPKKIYTSKYCQQREQPPSIFHPCFFSFHNFIKDLEQEITMNLIESQKMSHSYNATGENLARYYQTVVALNIMK